MWCLFVGNSRQTTRSVPWHRAPKYDRKLNLPLTMKWFLFQWFLNLCMLQPKGLWCILWKRSLDPGEVVSNSLRDTICQKLQNQFRTTCVPQCCIFTSQRFQTVLTRWPKTFFVLSCSVFGLDSINQTRTMPNVFFLFSFIFFLLKYLDSSCQSTRGAPILNSFTFGIHNCMCNNDACFWNLTSNDGKRKHYFYCWGCLSGRVGQQRFRNLIVE